MSNLSERTGAYSGDSTELVYLRARYYTPSTGRFTSKDTWAGDVNQPASFNSWNYGYNNPITYTDPSGYWPCDVEIDGKCIFVPGWRLPTADYVPESSAWNPQNRCGCSVWNLANWQLTDESWTSWLKALNAYSVICNTEPGLNDHVTWYDKQGRISQEELLTILIAKEVNSWLPNEDARKAHAEAIGRIYWNYCGPNGCRIVHNIADSRLISFFAYFKSWRNMSGGIKDILQGGDLVQLYRSKANEIAKDILSGGPGGAWKSGKDNNRPYDFGFVVRGEQPSWLISYLSGGPRGYGPHDVVWGRGEYGVKPEKGTPVFYVLTPNQKNELCFNASCFSIDKKVHAPAYVNDYLYGNK